MKTCQFFARASNPDTDRTLKKEGLFYGCTVVDVQMGANFSPCQPLPCRIAKGIATTLKWSMAETRVDLEIWLHALGDT